MRKLLLVFALFLAAPVYADETKPGFSNESEAGIVITAGNSESQSFSFRQLDFYRWDENTLRFDGKYLKTSSQGIESAKYWLLGLRYERGLVTHLSLFAGENIESDIFAGYLQRYNTDVGAKYYVIQEEAFYLFGEGGYRRAVENRFAGQVSQSLLRFYVEANRDWTKTFSTKAGFEYLPNLSISGDYQLNAGLSASAAINEIFALKTGYDLKFRKIPVAPASHNTDTQFTTAIVAKW